MNEPLTFVRLEEDRGNSRAIIYAGSEVMTITLLGAWENPSPRTLRKANAVLGRYRMKKIHRELERAVKKKLEEPGATRPWYQWEDR